MTIDAQTQRVLERLERDFAEHLEVTRRFIRQPSISADGSGIQKMAEMLAERIRTLGGAVEIHPTEGNPIVTGFIDAGQPHTILYYGMYDVQPVVGETWIVDPFGGQIVDLPGIGPSFVNRGVYNSKGPLLQFMHVIEAYQNELGGLPVNIKFILDGEEELGSPHLPPFVVAHKQELAADAAFFGLYSEDPTGKVVQYLGVKGLVFFELTCRGGAWGGPTANAVHGRHAVWFHSPTWRLVHALSSMLAPDQKQILIDGFYDDVASVSQHDEELLERLRDSFEPETQLSSFNVERFKYDLAGVDLLRKYLYLPSLNIDGLVSGHTAEGTKTILPHEARAKIDIRLVPNMTPERMVELVRAHLRQHGFADEVTLDVCDMYPWATGKVTDPPVQAMLRTYEQLGYQVEIWPILAGSAPFYLFEKELGITFAFGGPGHGGRAHEPNEYVTIDGMRAFERYVAVALPELARTLAAGATTG